MPRVAMFLVVPFLAAWPGADRLVSPGLPKDTLPSTLSLQDIPLGLDSNRPVPKDNPLTEAKVRLGRRLFFDPILSADGAVSCASCHDPAHGLAGQARLAVGIKGKQMHRNAPSLWNRAYGTSFFWDGRESSLEDQALRPIESSSEMGGTIEGAIERLRAQKEYTFLFEAAFGEGATANSLSKSLASFERVLLSGNSRVDRFRNGQVRALSDSERHGL